MSVVLGIGNPLMDHIAHVSQERLAALGVQPGTMQLVDAAYSAELRSSLADVTTLPGGSCANTLRGIGFLEGYFEGAEAEAERGVPASPVFVGVVGTDAEGAAYESALAGAGVDTAIRHASGATGTSTVLVTPDGERTMFTCLGVSLELAVADVDERQLAAADLFYAAGYMFDAPAERAALMHCVAQMRRRDRPVVFDIADPFVVDRHGAALREWLPGNVSVLLGNRDELTMLAADAVAGDEAVLTATASLAPVVVMKIGAAGATYIQGGKIGQVGTLSRVATDTTGAGDAFAAGFLHAWLQDRSLADACARGNRLAGGVVTVDGCDYSRIDRSLLDASSSPAVPPAG